MEIEKMHFDGQIWRPPYEASSQLLQVTAGCTYHKCKFCSLYPVSYTHLTAMAIYRGTKWIAETKAAKGLSCQMVCGSPLISVSYTHLDVSKRQFYTLLI